MVIKGEFMEKSKKLNFIGLVLLLLATLVWGTSFFILKETIAQVPTFFVIAVRFVVAGLGLLLIFIKKDKKTQRKNNAPRSDTRVVFNACVRVSDTRVRENYSWKKRFFNVFLLRGLSVHFVGVI